MTIFKIIGVEDQIIRGVIAAMLARGHTLSVNDGEETTLKRSTDAEAVFAAMRTTDEDVLIVHFQEPQGGRGWVRFIYGNEPHEVINDYTVNLEEELKPINAEIDKLFA